MPCKGEGGRGVKDQGCQQISYVEVVKRVEGARGNSVEDMVVDALQPVDSVLIHLGDLDTLIVKKVDFVAFITTVINCTAQVSKNSKKQDTIISAAEKFLGLQDFNAEA